MSTLKSINWALAWRRGVWTGVWAAMMTLLVIMCLDLAANQPVIFGIVMLAAFVGSIGLAYTRISWQNGAHGTAIAALFVSVLAICTHAFMEASYWSSVIDQINQEVSAERAVSDARAAVAEKRKERYVSSSNGKSAGQLDAEIKAAEQNALFARSASCTNATSKDSREFCQSYFLMQSKLAAAKEAGQLEGMIWSAGTTVEATTKRNLAAIAVMASSIFGGKPEQYTALIVITLVLFTQALLAFALVIGWAPEKPRTASRIGGAPEKSLTPAVALSPRSEMRPLSPALAKLVGVEPSSSKGGEDVGGSPSLPDGGGSPIAAPEAPKVEEPVDSRKVVSLFRDNGQLPEAQRGKKKGQKPELKAEAWLAASTTQTGNPLDTVTSGVCWKSYLAQCEIEDKRPMHRKAFSSKVGVLLGRKTGKGRKRDSKGSVFTGLMINPVFATARRRVA